MRLCVCVCVYVCVCVFGVCVCVCVGGGGVGSRTGHFSSLTERPSEASHTPHAALLNILVNLGYTVVVLKILFNPRVYMLSLADRRV